MNVMKCLYVFVVVSGVLTVDQLAARGEISLTPVGTPTFEVVDTHLFAAPTDAFPSVFPKHFPRVQHDSFSQEFADGLAITGLQDKDSYSVAEFSAPSAVHLGYVIVPGANSLTGTSQDSDNGPILSNANLPITIQGDVFLNGAIYEQTAFNLSLPPIDGFDGRSHFVVENWENSDFAPPGLASLVGDYEYRITLRDVGNNGYDISATFQVVPEPTTMMPCAFAVIAISLFALRRNKQNR